MEISDRLRMEVHKGSQIIVVDYKGLNEAEMIELVNKHRELTLITKCSFLADFHDCYATTNYMVHARRFVVETKNVINRGALVGIDPIKNWILKGIVLEYDVNFHSFDAADKAIEFLIDAKARKIS